MRSSSERSNGVRMLSKDILYIVNRMHKDTLDEINKDFSKIVNYKGAIPIVSQ